MKKTWKVLLIMAALLSLIVFSAFAADYENCADSLKSLGLFQGTDAGYELDR